MCIVDGNLRTCISFRSKYYSSRPLIVIFHNFTPTLTYTTFMYILEGILKTHNLPLMMQLFIKNNYLIASCYNSFRTSKLKFIIYSSCRHETNTWNHKVLYYLTITQCLLCVHTIWPNILIKCYDSPHILLTIFFFLGISWTRLSNAAEMWEGI